MAVQSTSCVQVLTVLQSKLNGSTQNHLAWDLCEHVAARFFFVRRLRLSIRFVSHQFPEFNFYLFYICSDAANTSFDDASTSLRRNIFNSCVFCTTVYRIDLAAFSPSRPSWLMVVDALCCFFLLLAFCACNYCHISCHFRCNISPAAAHSSSAERMRWRFTFPFKLFHFNMISLFPKRIIYLYMNLKEEKCAHTHS